MTPGCAVLDIGAGTGIWSIAAAKLGAGRVVAVDMDELLVGVIRMLAHEHGVSDRVEAICASSFDLQLGQDFDVVVSETIGFLGYDELIVEAMADARKRLLRDGGAIIPETVELYAAAGRLKTWTETVPTGVDFDFDKLDGLNLHSPRVLKRNRDFKLVTRPARLVSSDLRRSESTPQLRKLDAAWDLHPGTDIDAVIVWVESRLAPGVRLSTRRTTSWRPTVYRISPPSRPFPRVEFSLSLTSESNYWSVTFVDGETRETKKYSPEFAATEMVSAARGIGLTTEHGHLLIAHEDEKPSSIELREATSIDEGFLSELYLTTRREEVAAFGWSTEEQDAFLTMQFRMQMSSYAIQYPLADHYIVLCDAVPAGRMIVDRSGEAVLLTDIAVLPAFRGRGIASRLISRLQIESKAVVLNVDKQNSVARRLYEEHGFVPTGETDLAIEMRWTQPL